MGATARNSYSARLKLNVDRQMLARKVVNKKMSTRQLTTLVALYGMMGQICWK